MPCSWHRFPSPWEVGFYVRAFGNAILRERRSHLEESLIFAYSRHRFRHRRVCHAWNRMTFVVRGITSSSSLLSFVAWPTYRSVSRMHGF